MSQVLIKGISNTPLRLDLLSTFLLLCPLAWRIQKNECLETDTEPFTLPLIWTEWYAHWLTWLPGNKKLGMRFPSLLFWI